MNDPEFCYSCRVHHPRAHMHQWPTRQGLRWRCRRSIMAAHGSVKERDDFGRYQTHINQKAAQQVAEQKFVAHDEKRFRS